MTTVGEQYDKFRNRYAFLMAHDVMQFMYDYPKPLFKNMSEACKFERELHD
jgi:hypothetical protein